MRQLKLLGAFIAAMGLFFALMTFVIDMLGYGDPDVFGSYQVISLVLGIALIAAGIILWSRPPESAQKLQEIIANGYKTFAFWLLNIFILFVAINAIVGIYLVLRENDPITQPSEYPWEAYREYWDQIYPTHIPEEVEALLLETWDWGDGLECEPYTHYRDAPQDGTYINIDPNGFRHSADQAEWPPNPDDYVVFVFGGSTALGYWLPDSETIPSYLQAHLREEGVNASIYNFGRGNYFSTQEVILLQSLIREGIIPDAVVFIEGLNEFSHPSGYPKVLGICTEEGLTVPTRAADSGDELPIMTLIEDIGSGNPASVADSEPAIRPESAEQIEVINHDIIQRFLANLRFAISTSEAYDIDILVVLQPVPSYHYDQTYYPYVIPDTHRYNWINLRTPAGYKALLELKREGTPELQGMLDLSDMQLDRHEILYVDMMHYTAAFSSEIAAEISEALIEVMESQ
jgi:hypothetical protein